MVTSERFRSLPSESLSIIGTTNVRLAEAYDVGQFDFSKGGINEFHKAHFTSIYRLLNIKNPRPDIMAAHTIAENLSKIDSYTPLVVLTLSPQIVRNSDGNFVTQPITMDRIVFSHDVSGMKQKDAINETFSLIEDNVGRIEMMIRRFGEPQQPHQV